VPLRKLAEKFALSSSLKAANLVKETNVDKSFQTQHKRLHPEAVIDSKIKIVERDAGTDDDVVSEISSVV
jgi:hypothetical protein